MRTHRKKIASAPRAHKVPRLLLHKGFRAIVVLDGSQHLSPWRIIWVCTVLFLCIFGRERLIDSSFFNSVFLLCSVCKDLLWSRGMCVRMLGDNRICL